MDNRPFHRLRCWMRVRYAAPMLAAFSVLAAILLPAVHAHNDLDEACHSSIAARDNIGHHCDAPCHDKHPAPQHNEHTCELCHLIAITSVGLSPTLDAPICAVRAQTTALLSVEAQCPTALDLPPSIPARGPPVA